MPQHPHQAGLLCLHACLPAHGHITHLVRQLARGGVAKGQPGDGGGQAGSIALKRHAARVQGELLQRRQRLQVWNAEQQAQLLDILAPGPPKLAQGAQARQPVRGAQRHRQADFQLLQPPRAGACLQAALHARCQLCGPPRRPAATPPHAQAQAATKVLCVPCQPGLQAGHSQRAGLLRARAHIQLYLQVLQQLRAEGQLIEMLADARSLAQPAARAAGQPSIRGGHVRHQFQPWLPAGRLHHPVLKSKPALCRRPSCLPHRAAWPRDFPRTSASTRSRSSSGRQ